jgi:hypothetical protein
MMGRTARRVLAAGGGAAPRLLAAIVLRVLLLPGATRSEESSREAAAWTARGDRGRGGVAALSWQWPARPRAACLASSADDDATQPVPQALWQLRPEQHMMDPLGAPGRRQLDGRSGQRVVPALEAEAEEAPERAAVTAQSPPPCA